MKAEHIKSPNTKSTITFPCLIQSVKHDTIWLAGDRASIVVANGTENYPIGYCATTYNAVFWRSVLKEATGDFILLPPEDKIILQNK